MIITGDGSNDTGLGFLVLNSVLLLAVFTDHANVIQITEVLVVVESVSNNEGVRNGESNVVGDVSVGEGSLLDQKRSNLNRLGRVLLQLGQQLDHGLSSINDILDNQNVLRRSKSSEYTTIVSTLKNKKSSPNPTAPICATRAKSTRSETKALHVGETNKKRCST